MQNKPYTFSENNTESKLIYLNIVKRSSQLMKLFENQLKYLLWAEKTLTNVIPKMIKNATSNELIEALTIHLAETEKHIRRVEQVFESIGKNPVAKKCEAMDGLITEADEILEDCENGAMCDAGIIFVAQKVEHYEIATYGTLRQFAKTLGLTLARNLFEITLSEEKTTDKKLTEIAINVVNRRAAEPKD